MTDSVSCLSRAGGRQRLTEATRAIGAAVVLVIAIVAAVWPAPSRATTADPDSAAPSEAAATAADEARREVALNRARAAVVGVEVAAVENARSIATLGAVRQGSGVVIGDDGLVLTIGYLILEADHVDLVLDDDHRVPARVVAYDLDTGFGLLQALAPLALAPVPLGLSNAVTDDEPLMVASGGDEGSLSLARMLGRRAYSGYWEYHIEGALFTAPARSDHSGAALFNADGELLGIGSLLVNDAAGADAPPRRGNMFVPVDLLKPILPELRARGASHLSTRAWLGLNCVDYEGHVRVVKPAPQSPAEEAGLQSGDLIVAVDGSDVADLASFYKTLWHDSRADRDVSLDVVRNGALLHVPVHAVDRMKTLSRPQGI